MRWLDPVVSGLFKPRHAARSLSLCILVLRHDRHGFIEAPFTKSAVWTVVHPRLLNFLQHVVEKKSIVSEGELDLTHNSSMIAR